MKNITTLFIVPTLGISKNLLKEFNFLSSFQVDPNSGDVYSFDVVYLVFKPENTHKFEMFVDTEKNRTEFLIDDYDYPEGLVVLVYKLNPVFKKDYDLVKLGKYSKTSTVFKKLFPDTISVNTDKDVKTMMSLQTRVFNKSKELAIYWEKKLNLNLEENSELWSSQDIVNEELNLEKILENKK